MRTETKTTATPPLITAANLEAFQDDAKTRRLSRALVAARRAAKATRAKVDAYIAPIFGRYGFVHEETGKPLAGPEQLYLSEQDALIAEYYAECDAAHREHGYALNPGYCPALVAEHAAITAENALLDHAGAWFGITNIRSTSLDLRTEALDLFLRIAS